MPPWPGRASAWPTADGLTTGHPPILPSHCVCLHRKWAETVSKTQLSKADKIRKFLHLDNAEIAKRVGVLPAYVRAVRQRTSEVGNPINGPVDKWKAANPDKVLRYAKIGRMRLKADPEKYTRKKKRDWERRKERYHSDPAYRERTLEVASQRRCKRRAEARAS